MGQVAWPIVYSALYNWKQCQTLEELTSNELLQRFSERSRLLCNRIRICGYSNRRDNIHFELHLTTIIPYNKHRPLYMNCCPCELHTEQFRAIGFLDNRRTIAQDNFQQWVSNYDLQWIPDGFPHLAAYGFALIHPLIADFKFSEACYSTGARRISSLSISSHLLSTLQPLTPPSSEFQQTLYPISDKSLLTLSLFPTAWFLCLHFCSSRNLIAFSIASRWVLCIVPNGWHLSCCCRRR